MRVYFGSQLEDTVPDCRASLTTGAGGHIASAVREQSQEIAAVQFIFSFASVLCMSICAHVCEHLCVLVSVYMCV